MIMMKPRKPAKATIAPQLRELGNDRSFLDVLRETCARDGGRYTLRVESGGVDYTVLVDRGGPFNAIGGGSVGSRALVNASQLRSGRCVTTIGWPVDQPLYQPGLDVTMRALVEGVVEPRNLPRHRGVESLRNAEWRAADPAPIVSTRPDPAGEALAVPAETPAPVAPAVVSAPAVVLAPAVVMAPAPAPAPQPAAVVAPTPAAAPAVVIAPAPTPDPKMAWKPMGSASAWLPETDLPAALPAAERPARGKVHASGQGTAKHLATQALLWLVECENPSQYNLEQAATLARQGLSAGVSQVVHPFRRDINQRINRIKEDWDTSGQVAARATRKKLGKSIPVNDDPDREFRLR